MQAFDRLTAQLEQLNIPYLRDARMAAYTTFCIGGAMPLMIEPQSEQQLVDALRATDELGLFPLLLGRGSNVLFPDSIPLTPRSLVVRTTHVRTAEVKGKSICAACGAALGELARMAQRAALGGLEFAYGIPGTLGGALCMNAGAYGTEMRDVVETVRCYDRERHEIVCLDREQMAFSYRHSLLLSSPHLVALGATLALHADDAQAIDARMRDYMARRRDKQPLDLPSAGSVFKRPEGHFAGALIEQSGLKGYRIGGAMVSPKHAGFIVNVGGATAQDVLSLIAHIQAVVERDHGVYLEPEIQILNSLYAR